MRSKVADKIEHQSEYIIVITRELDDLSTQKTLLKIAVERKLLLVGRIENSDRERVLFLPKRYRHCRRDQSIANCIQTMVIHMLIILVFHPRPSWPRAAALNSILNAFAQMG